MGNQPHQFGVVVQYFSLFLASSTGNVTAAGSTRRYDHQYKQYFIWYKHIKASLFIKSN